jgi:glycosyltransferase involved in cell wall biosynthesis
MTDPRPLVSICIPTYQGASWIRETLASALAQDYPRVEVVVSDDASTDGTADIVSSLGNGRVRVIGSERRVGMARNWNRCVRAARGEYIKLLMQDDLLEPDCISALAAVLDRHPEAGFVFSPRNVLLDDPSDPDARRWLRDLGTLHDALEPLLEINDGRRILAVMQRERFGPNHIGEPTVVLMRHVALEQVGLFNAHLGQVTDLEMWLRLAGSFDVGFVRRPLATFRVHRGSASTVNSRSGAAWLDRVWLVEGLRQRPELRKTVGQRDILLVWAETARAEAKRQVKGLLAGHSLEIRRLGRDLREYVEYRNDHPRPPLHEPLGPSAVDPTRSG